MQARFQPLHKPNFSHNHTAMLNEVVRDYCIVAPIPKNDQVYNGDSAATKEIVHHVFTDNSRPRTVLDIGFGIGELARVVKTHPATAHWQVDGIDGFERTCQNVPLFERGWYRNIWHGLAQHIPRDVLASYDLLCLFDVIEHLDAPTAKQLLKALLEALGPDSRLVVSTPLWFYPQHQNHAGDLEEHLIGVPARSLLALRPRMYLVTPAALVGNFVFGKESLHFIDQFQPTTDRSFGIREGLEHMAALGMKADNVLYKVPETLASPVAPAVPAAMKQTPAHNTVNGELLGMVPHNARRVVEVGCMHGALAQAVRQAQPGVHYVGIDIDADYVQVAAQHCTEALSADIETMGDARFNALFPSDCWIFGDCLEHLRDPWAVLRRVRARIADHGCMLVCIPNAQHWSLQMRMAAGQFRYEDSGLLDRTHLRWFTRITLDEMFEQTGWRVEAGLVRTLNTPLQPQMLGAVRAFARAAGLDEDMAERDATPFQYVYKLVPN